MSSAEFTQWKAYYTLEPWGYEMDNFHAGVIAASVVNVAPRKKGTKGMVPSDFYPARKKGAITLSPRQIKELHERQLKIKRSRKPKNG